jgi:exosortase A-associated hydrolase 1
MATREVPLVIRCRGEDLAGVLALPPRERPAADTAVLVVVGGPQYRAGSHRQFVALSRRVAAAGHPALRFDVRGMGDSSGRPRTFEALDDDVACAIDALVERCPAVERVVLWGLCDGASAAALYVRRRRDPRVAGMCLVNPWVRSAEGLARARVKHYYRDRLFEKSFWLKLVRGGVGAGALGDLWQNVRAAGARRREPAPLQEPFQVVMRYACESFDGRILLVLSGKDLTAQEFTDLCGRDPAWQRAISRDGVTRTDLPAANHTMSDPVDQQQMEAVVVDWLALHFRDRRITTDQLSTLETS